MKSKGTTVWRLLLILAMILLNVTAVSAAPSGSVVSSATPSNANPTIGSTITVTINIDMTGVNAPDNKLGSFTGTLTWDPAILTYVSYSGHPPTGFTGVVNEGSVGTGTVTFNGSNANGSTGNITAIVITFNVVAAGTSALDLNYSVMGAATTFNSLLGILTTNDGSVTVAAATTPTPTNTTVVPTPTATNTTVVPTPTRTNTTVVPTPTATNTTVVPTPTRTNTTVVPTPTRTNTPVAGCAGAVSSASPSNSTPVVGTQVVVTINIDMTGVPAGNNKLGSFTGSLGWNTAVLDYVSNGGLPSGFTGVVNDTNVDAGTITFNGANASGATGNITALTITFNVVGAGTSPLDLAYSAMSAASTFCDLLPGATVNDSSVTASAAATPTRTNTSVLTPTRTATPTNTTVVPTPTRTNTPVSGCAGAVSSASPSNSSPAVGTQIVVTINIDMTGVPAGNNKLGSFTGTLNWNTAVLQYVSNGGLPGGFTGVINTDNTGTGLLTFNGANASGATGNITALTITFNVVGAGTSPLDLAYSAMSAATTFCDLLPGLTTNDGSVTTSGGATPTRTNTSVATPTRTRTPTPTNTVPGPTPTRTNTPVPGTCNGAKAAAQPSTSSPTVGQSITVNIFHDMTGVAAPNNLLGSFTAQLTWNTAVLQYVSNSGLPSGWTGVVNVDNAGSGVINFNGANASGVSGAGTALSITFNVIGTGTSPLDLSYSAMSTAQTFCDLLPGLTVTDGSVTATSAGGCDGAAASAIPSNAAPSVGNTITVDIYHDMTGVASPNNYLGSFTAQLTWNASILQYVSNSGLPSGWTGVINVDNAGSGVINFNGAKTDGSTGAGVALTLTFNVIGTGTTPLDLSYSAMSSTAPNFCNLLPGLTVTDGSVTVGGTPPTCYGLTLSHTGNGSDPVASPPNSTGCSSGRYTAGAVVGLTASPDSGWTVGSWSGTDNNASTSTSNQVTMPAADRAAAVNYVEGGTAQYMLTTVVSPAGWGWTTPWAGEHMFNAGEIVNVTATPYEGYRFDHWEGACTGAGACQVVMDGPKTVIAYFAELTYQLEIAADPAEGGTTNPAVGDHYYKPGTIVDIVATPNSGWNFDHWSGACSGSGDCSIVMDDNKTVTAHFSRPDYTLTVVVDPAGGGTTDPAAGEHIYPAGTVVNLSAAPATGWMFTGWSGACSGSGSCQVTMDMDQTVTAHFEQQWWRLTVAVEPAGAGTTVPAEGEHPYLAGTVVDVTATPATNYVFTGWSGACTGSGPCQVTMDAHKTVTAHFALKQYTLTMAVDPAGSGTTDPAVGDHLYNAGTLVNITATPGTGYAFDFWTGACTGSGACSVTMNADQTVTAHFKRIMFNLTVAVNPIGAGTTDPAVGVHAYESGSVVVVTATPATGFTFTGWSGACTGTDPCSITMDADKSVTANFSGIFYNLTVAVNPAGGGTTDPAVGVHAYAAGSVVAVTATPATGYTFTGWSGACTGTGACSITMDADKSVTANFAQVQQYSLTVVVTPAGGGTTNPAAGVHAYTAGTVVTVTATPAPDYVFTGWSGACTGTGSCVVTMDSSKTVTANFSLFVKRIYLPWIAKQKVN